MDTCPTYQTVFMIDHLIICESAINSGTNSLTANPRAMLSMSIDGIVLISLKCLESLSGIGHDS